MKKLRVIAAMAGITALVIGAATTYAWYTSLSEPTTLNVNTAKIYITETEIPVDVSYKLPGETFGYEGWPIYNESTRESVVRFRMNAVSIQNNDKEPLERASELLGLINGSTDISGIIGIENGTNFIYSPIGSNDIYIWLDAEEQLVSGEISMLMTLPEILGGNTLIPLELGGDGYKRYDNLLEEQETTVILECSAFAVQGTYAAVEDIFGLDIAEAFYAMGKLQ